MSKNEEVVTKEWGTKGPWNKGKLATDQSGCREGERRCSKCRKVKKLSDGYWKSKRGIGGYNAACKTCMKTSRDREKLKKAQRRYWRKNTWGKVDDLDKLYKPWGMINRDRRRVTGYRVVVGNTRLDQDEYSKEEFDEAVNYGTIPDGVRVENIASGLVFEVQDRELVLVWETDDDVTER